GRDRTPAVDGDPDQRLALPPHGLPVLVPVRVLARDAAEVLDQAVLRVPGRHVQYLGGPVDLNVGVVPRIGVDQDGYRRIAAGVDRLRAVRIGGDDDA